MKRRLPAEWEPQDAILLTLPHAQTDWAPILSEAKETFKLITQTISRFQSVLLVVPPNTTFEPQHNVTPIKILSNDTWSRDFGPITIEDGGHPALLDFTFNGWGNKFLANRDNAITKQLHQKGLFGSTPLKTIDFILEGGSIESDGNGTILTTKACLLNPNRNPGLSAQQIEETLKKELGAHDIKWLNYGNLIGDDTDAHIDTLVRFAPNQTILYVCCSDPNDKHFHELKAMEQELAELFPSHRRLALPWPSAKFDFQNDRLPATYANYLVINGAVLVPTYNDPADQTALSTIKEAFPDRKIIGIDCSTLIKQHGSLHCVTMQIPKGALPTGDQ